MSGSSGSSTGVPLIRLAPVEGPIAAGPDDPGGQAWIWRQALITSLTVGLLRAGWRRGRRALPGSAARS